MHPPDLYVLLNLLAPLRDELDSSYLDSRYPDGYGYIESDNGDVGHPLFQVGHI